MHNTSNNPYSNTLTAIPWGPTVPRCPGYNKEKNQYNIASVYLYNIITSPGNPNPLLPFCPCIHTYYYVDFLEHNIYFLTYRITIQNNLSRVEGDKDMYKVYNSQRTIVWVTYIFSNLINDVLKWICNICIIMRSVNLFFFTIYTLFNALKLTLFMSHWEVTRHNI